VPTDMLRVVSPQRHLAYVKLCIDMCAGKIKCLLLVL